MNSRELLRAAAALSGIPGAHLLRSGHTFVYVVGMVRCGGGEPQEAISVVEDPDDSEELIAQKTEWALAHYKAQQEKAKKHDQLKATDAMLLAANVKGAGGREED